MTNADGRKLFEDLSEHCMTFHELLNKFRALPQAEQDRFLVPGPTPAKTKATGA
jgi:hypothetical protein